MVKRLVLGAWLALLVSGCPTRTIYYDAGSDATSGTGGSAGGEGGAAGVSPGGAGSGGGAGATCEVNASRCSNNSLETCGPDGNWHVAAICSIRETCSEAGTPARCVCSSDPVCTSVGNACAAETTVASCAQDGDGCFYQQSTLTCGGGFVCERHAGDCQDPNWAEWPMPNTGADVATGAPNAESYTDNGDGTVTDNVTGLMWQQQASSTEMSWSAAVPFCSTVTTGSHKDWRLPTYVELQSIVDYSQPSTPFIDPLFFPNTPSFIFWSSTVFPSSQEGWEVLFVPGSPGISTGSYYVRCVR